MAVLPAQPSLDHLRREARDLLRAARSGDESAAARVGAASARLTLAAAQLAVARDYGFASWAKLKAEVEVRAADLARLAQEFLQASIGDWTGKATRMLAARPELAGYDTATAVVLGDVARVRRAIAADPGVATRPDPLTAWTALHAVSASRWHQLDPARADGLLGVAVLLLDAGADPNLRAGGTQWTPLLCAVAGAPSPAITRVLLDRGAVPDDNVLYLAGFEESHECLRMLLAHGSVRVIARKALAAPVSGNDAEGVALLLNAGADPGQYHDDDDQPVPAVWAAVRAGCSAELIGLLLAHGASPSQPGPDSQSPIALATRKGRADLAALLRERGAADDTTDADRLVAACLSGDAAAAERLTTSQPGLLSQLPAGQQAGALIQAAEVGDARATALMLDTGFAIGARGGDSEATALHAAAFAGSAAVARLLVERGADVEARDGQFDGTPVGWAVVGSGFRPDGNPAADWLDTITVLIEAGAGLDGITLSPDDQKPPSPEVADLLRRRGVRDQPG